MLTIQEQITALKNEFELIDPSSIVQNNLLFISISNQEQRATVKKARGRNWSDCWSKAMDIVKNWCKTNQNTNILIKVDWVTSISPLPYSAFEQLITQTKTNYFRKGISFDPQFQIAFLEQEINGNAFIVNDPQHNRKQLSWSRINRYIKENNKVQLALSRELVKGVYTFETKGLLHDGINLYELESGTLNNGRRKCNSMDQDTLLEIIKKSSTFLAQQIQEDGSYIYGYFPCYDTPIDHYNILRHASSTYSLIEAYQCFPSEQLEETIKLALQYLLTNALLEFTNSDGIRECYIVEASLDHEIKLGANAAAILAIVEYTKTFNDKIYLETANALALGIKRFQQVDGSFVHVLNASDLSLKEANRVVYYDGEATFALMRLYKLTKHSEWLDMVKRAFIYFNAQHYWKYKDHWLSYASYEAYCITQENHFFDFNLKNAAGILDFCLVRETTFPTLLELLLATSRMIEERKKIAKDIHWGDFDEEKFNRAISFRLHQQLNGYFYPEWAMYFKSPEKIQWSFFIRHHAFRVRIDDVEHNLSGYCTYFNILKEHGGES